MFHNCFPSPFGLPGHLMATVDHMITCILHVQPLGVSNHFWHRLPRFSKPAHGPPTFHFQSNTIPPTSLIASLNMLEPRESASTRHQHCTQYPTVLSYLYRISRHCAIHIILALFVSARMTSQILLFNGSGFSTTLHHTSNPGPSDLSS